MPDNYLIDRLALSDEVVAMMHGSSLAILATVTVTAFLFSSLRSMFLGGRDPIAVLLRAVFCSGLLFGYHSLFDSMVDISTALTSSLSQFADMDRVWASWADNLAGLMAAHQGDLGGQVEAYVQGYVLKGVVATVNFMAFLTFEAVQVITALFLTVLRVFGPLMIVFGVFGGAETLKAWFRACVQVLAWPAIPPLCMLLVNVGAADQWADATMPFLLAQSVLLGLMCLLTPVIVSFLLGQGGIGGLASVAFSGAALMATAGAHRATDGFKSVGQGAGKGAAKAAVAGGAAFGQVMEGGHAKVMANRFAPPSPAPFFPPEDPPTRPGGRPSAMQAAPQEAPTRPDRVAARATSGEQRRTA